jgi:hypothetical protein
MQYRCKSCGNAIQINQIGRRRRQCDECRNRRPATIPYARKLGCESALQCIDPPKTNLSHVAEFEPSEKRVRSRKNLHWENANAGEQKLGRKASPSVTWKLTDGKQVNTGSGRASRALGYVMEIAPDQWVARVRDCASEPLSFAAAKKAAEQLYLSKAKGEKCDWIYELNRAAAKAYTRAALLQEKRERAAFLANEPPLDDELWHYIVEVETKAPLRRSGPFLVAERNEYLDQIEDVAPEEVPDIPAFLERRKPELACAAA